MKINKRIRKKKLKKKFLKGAIRLGCNGYGSIKLKGTKKHYKSKEYKQHIFGDDFFEWIIAWDLFKIHFGEYRL